jgi:hypothetical protein
MKGKPRAKKKVPTHRETWIEGRREIVTLVRRQAFPFAAGVLRGEVSPHRGEVVKT